MESVSTTNTRLADRIEPAKGGGAFPCLDIEFDESAGSLRIYDPRLFQAGRRGFCERLLKAASRQPGLSRQRLSSRRLHVTSSSAPAAQTALCMANSFVRAVREASAGSSLLDRFWWWRRRGGWSSMTAFRLPQGVSLWKAFEVRARPDPAPPRRGRR